MESNVSLKSAIEIVDDYEEKTLCSSYKDGGGNGGGHVSVSSDRSIIPELNVYDKLDSEIKNQADVIYNLMYKSTRRGKVRKQLLFYCCYCAYLELHRNIDPIYLGKQFGLTSGDVQRCDSLFSEIKTGYKLRVPTYTSPLVYIPGYCEQLGLSEEAAQDAVELGKSILNKDVTLLQESPQTVSAGLFHYFNVMNGIKSDDPAISSRITGRSNATIDAMFKRISRIDNS